MTADASTRIIYNGLCSHASWTCGGYVFERLDDYETQIQHLPRLGRLIGDRKEPARRGQNAPTFRVRSLFDKKRRSVLYPDGEALDDIIAVWSFAGGQRVIKDREGELPWPPHGELSYDLVEEAEIPWAIEKCCVPLWRRPPKRLVRSALLTYLQVAFGRVVEVKITLTCAVLEALAPLDPPRAGRPRSRYGPIIDLLMSLPVSVRQGISREQMEDFCVALFRMRNGFVHNGIQPWRDDIPVGAIRTTTGRVVRVGQLMTKLAVARAIGFPTDRWEAGSVEFSIGGVFRTGAFTAAHQTPTTVRTGV